MHFDWTNAPDELIQIEIELPNSASVKEIQEADLPAGWNQYPAPATVQATGSSWQQAGESVALIVPSAIIPTSPERCVILNVDHEEFADLKEVKREIITVDPRLLKPPR